MSEHELSRRFGNDDDAVIEALDKRDAEIERLKKALNSRWEVSMEEFGQLCGGLVERASQVLLIIACGRYLGWW